MLRERIKEIVDFAKSESPYRSANKGWVTNDIFLQWGASNEASSKELDQLAKVTVFWQPIIQTLLIIFLIICLAIFIAFSPLAISNGKFDFLNRSIEAAQNLSLSNNSVDSTSTNEILLSKEIDEVSESKSSSNKSQDLTPTNKTPVIQGIDEGKGLVLRF